MYQKGYANRGNQRPAFNRGFNKFSGKQGTANRPTVRDMLREKDPSVFDMASFIRSSSELKRYCSLALIQLYRKEGKLDPEDKVYVRFALTHYTIKVNGLGEDKKYDTTIFLKAFAASIQSFALYANNLISEVSLNNFNEPLSESELVSEASQEEIKDTAAQVLKHISDSNVVVEDDKD